MNIRRLHYSQRPNIYPAYLINNVVKLFEVGVDEWDFTAIDSWNDRYLNSDIELIQILNPDIIVKVEHFLKKTKSALYSGTVYSHSKRDYQQKVLR